MRNHLIHATLLVAGLLGGGALAATLMHNEAVMSLSAADPIDRFVALERLAEVGAMQDADAVLERLFDDDPRVRLSASNAIWQIWGRSGDSAIDEQMARGAGQMQAGALTEALVTFDEVVRARPAFAEGWNKRATVYYLLGRDPESLADCDQVFRLNPRHFGALAGAAQIHLRQGRPEQALTFFHRAVAINPNLDGAAQMIPLLEKLLSERAGRTI